MSIVFDTSEDCEIWDNQVSVTLTSTRLAGTLVDTVAGALARQLTMQEKATSGGAYEGATLTWLLPRKNVQIGPLKQADVVEANEGPHVGRVFTALQADLGCEQAFWRMVCVDLSIVHDLRDRITIERPTISYDASGVAVLTFPPDGGREVYRNLKAKVQLISEDRAEERLIEGFRGTHTVTVEKQIVLEPYDRIKWVEAQTTYYLDTVALRNPSRLDELPVVDARLKP